MGNSFLFMYSSLDNKLLANTDAAAILINLESPLLLLGTGQNLLPG
jgi:hypothetical protein